MAYDTQTVGELVAEQPGRAKVFQQHGIDFCCGGKRSLATACESKGVALADVIAGLEAADAAPAADQRDWTTAPLAELADHIVQTHHAYLREELPRLGAMAERVAQVHGERVPYMVDVRDVFFGLAEELASHMMKEEQILFPLCKQLEAGDAAAGSHCGSVNNPIAVMEHEHDQAGSALERMNELTDGYRPPADACNTFRALLHGLAELEADMHLHIHKENNILFPRASELEGSLLAH